jgi:hypothetical protein
MEKKEKPRPIQFMLRGFSVAQMLEILEAWDTLTEDEIKELGFNVSAESRSATVPFQSAKLH